MSNPRTAPITLNFLVLGALAMVLSGCVIHTGPQRMRPNQTVVVMGGQGPVRGYRRARPAVVHRRPAARVPRRGRDIRVPVNRRPAASVRRPRLRGGAKHYRVSKHPRRSKLRATKRRNRR